MILRKIYIKISQASVLIPIIYGVINFKALTLPFKILFYFFIVSALFEIQSSIAIEVYHNNMPGLHIYTIIEFLVFSAVYYLNIRENKLLRLLVVINALAFMIVALTDIIHNGMMSLNTLSRSYSSAFMIMYSLGYLYYLFTLDDLRYLRDYPMFWICSGALIYFAGNSQYFMMKSYLMNKYIGVEWASHLIHAALNIIANCLYAQSFRCLGKQKMTS